MLATRLGSPTAAAPSHARSRTRPSCCRVRPRGAALAPCCSIGRAACHGRLAEPGISAHEMAQERCCASRPSGERARQNLRRSPHAASRSPRASTPSAWRLTAHRRIRHTLSTRQHMSSARVFGARRRLFDEAPKDLSGLVSSVGLVESLAEGSDLIALEIGQSRMQQRLGAIYCGETSPRWMWRPSLAPASR